MATNGRKKKDRAKLMWMDGIENMIKKNTDSGRMGKLFDIEEPLNL